MFAWGVLKFRVPELKRFCIGDFPMYTFLILNPLWSTEPLIEHGKKKIVPCIKFCTQDDLVIMRK